MKKFLLPLGTVLVLLSSCKEKGPSIDFGGARAFDTTYFTTAVEAAQPHRILLEEYTGVTCPNCPFGHEVIADLEAKYPDRVLAVGYHPYGQGQSQPKENKSRFDFRNEEATGLGNILGGIPFLPAGSIDRIPFNGKILDSRSSWTQRADDQIAAVTANKVNISITSDFADGAREGTIKVRAMFTEDVSKKLLLHILLLENDIIDFQEYPNREEEDYTHNHILRDFITPVAGAGLIDSIATKTRGRVFERTILYKLPDMPAGIVPANCKILAFISSGEPGDLEVYQAAEVSLR